MATPADTLPGKRLVLFFDGTWNEPGDHTNVWRLYLTLARTGRDGVPQAPFYDEGVGTRWYDRVTGGAFGAGLSENVRRGYRWLMEHYDPDDEIYIFGFSRGAFTARSLAGVLSRCGLLKPDAPLSFRQLYERYQEGEAAPAIYDMKYFHVAPRNFEDRALLAHTHYRRGFIRMVGVWDTVGSLGIPFGSVKGVSRRTLRFHNTRLSTTVQHCYHALALDEYRAPYGAVLWTHFIPEGSASRTKDTRTVEQRWFAGAHANVGGGYRSDLLSQRPLAWMQEKAQACGLTFRSVVAADDADFDMLPRDSYSEFLAGWWKRGRGRFVRPLLPDAVYKPTRAGVGRQTSAGWVVTANERIDLSVFRRCQRYPDYRPPGLAEWASRKRLDLARVIEAPERYPSLWAPVTGPGIELDDAVRAAAAEARRE